MQIPYGRKRWTIYLHMNRGLETADMWFYRGILRIQSTEQVSNGNVFRKTGTKSIFVLRTRRKTTSYFGGINRKGDVENLKLTRHTKVRRTEKNIN